MPPRGRSQRREARGYTSSSSRVPMLWCCSGGPAMGLLHMGQTHRTSSHFTRHLAGRTRATEEFISVVKTLTVNGLHSHGAFQHLHRIPKCLTMASHSAIDSHTHTPLSGCCHAKVLPAPREQCRVQCLDQSQFKHEDSCSPDLYRQPVDHQFAACSPN